MIDFTNLRIEDYLAMLWKRKWYGIWTAVIVTGVVTFYAWRLPHIYRSETTILVQAQGIAEGYVKPANSDRMVDRLTGVSLEVQSRSLLERAIKDFNLYGYGTLSNFSMDTAVTALRDNLEVKTNADAGTIRIAFFSPQPPLSRDVTNRLAQYMISSQTSSREEVAVNTDQFIDDQLHQTEKDLAAQEDKLKTFKMQHLGALPEQNAANLTALNGLHSQLISNESASQRAEDQQSILEQRLQDQKRLDLLSQDMMTKMGDKSGSRVVSRTSPRKTLLTQLETKQSQLADLTSKYTDKFPDVVRLRQEIQDLELQLSKYPPENSDDSLTSQGVGGSTSPAVGNNDGSAIRVQIATLKREIAARTKEHDDILKQIQIYQARLNLSPRVEQELFSITRSYESLREHYKSLQDKKFNARVGANLEKSDRNEVFKIIDPAYLPEKPVRPNRRQIALLGLLAGIGMGLGMVIAVEYFDPALGGEEMAASHLGLPVLICFPEVRAGGKVFVRSRGREARLLKHG
jgi:succinoglycan biosynthesis transport protein ExoP